MDVLKSSFDVEFMGNPRKKCTLIRAATDEQHAISTKKVLFAQYVECC